MSCVVACAEAWRGDGEILASPMGPIPTLGARLARATFSPELLLSDGEAYLLHATDRRGLAAVPAVFTVVASGRRHVMMGASQIDRFGNQNISCIGDWARPTVAAARRARRAGQHHQPPDQLLGAKPLTRGLRREGRHGLRPGLRPRGGRRRFHEIRVVVTNLAVLDFDTPDRDMRLRSVHPGVTVETSSRRPASHCPFPTLCPPPGSPPTRSWKSSIG